MGVNDKHAATFHPGEPCQCWIREPPVGHSGHCCFKHPDPDGTAYQHGQAPPCGHWHPHVPRPTQEAH